ncbi:MAG TPA: hypothetical protein VGL31_18655 [Xanthobacteraceae bacterium]
MTPAATARLGTIPVAEIAPGEQVRHAIDDRARAQSLRDDCLAWLPRAARLTLPAMDAVTRHWLERSASPYVAEIAAIAAALDHSGIWFLNGCYQWGCTALVREEAGTPWLARTLDWPFPGLGRHVEIARMRGPAGAFDTVTWPGFVGILTACAPGRFAACVNQAPLRRRTRHPWLRAYDIGLNALATGRIRFMPPDHLLREVFETCGSFSEARHRLETTPVARPVIYTLAGCRRGERCVIERTEQDFESREEDTGAANDWLRPRPAWEARVSSRALFTRTYEEAAERNLSRRRQLAAWPGEFARGSFDWVTPPVLNPFTRLAVEMCPGKGVLRAVGYETLPDRELAQPVTHVCELTAACAA